MEKNHHVMIAILLLTPDFSLNEFGTPLALYNYATLFKSASLPEKALLNAGDRIPGDSRNNRQECEDKHRDQLAGCGLREPTL
jgi:hypothetical protein